MARVVRKHSYIITLFAFHFTIDGLGKQTSKKAIHKPPGVCFANIDGVPCKKLAVARFLSQSQAVKRALLNWWTINSRENTVAGISELWSRKNKTSGHRASFTMPCFSISLLVVELPITSHRDLHTSHSIARPSPVSTASSIVAQL